MKRIPVVAAVLLGTVVLAPSDAHAGSAYAVSIAQVGSNVNFLGSGNFYIAGRLMQASNVGANPAILSDNISIVVGASADAVRTTGRVRAVGTPPPYSLVFEHAHGAFLGCDRGRHHGANSGACEQFVEDLRIAAIFVGVRRGDPERQFSAAAIDG